MKPYPNIPFGQRIAGLVLGALVVAGPAAATEVKPASVASAPAVTERIEPYRPRFGRTRALVAVVGENSATELTDFVIPYGVLSRSGAADVVSVATQPGVLKLRPAVQIQPDTTTDEFDRRYPDGADYVIVPATDMYGAAIVNGWSGRYETVGVPLSPRVDEIAVALTADVYSRTYRRVKAVTVSATADPVRTLGGLMFVPDRVVGHSAGPDRMLPSADRRPSMDVLDEALDRVSREYGRVAAASAAYDLEYARRR
jgi:hypothetical protein